MANQMIALQSRNPQLPDPSRGAAQFANMMNMASQQRASQLQGERIRQEMEFAKAKEGREVDMQSANIREKDLDYQLKDIKRLRNIGVAVLQSGNEDAYQSWVGMVEKADQQLGATLRQVAPNFNPEIMQSVIMEADKYIDKTVPTAEATLEYTAEGQKDEQGNLIPEDTPVQVTTGMKPSTQVIRSTPNAAPRATPTAAPQTTTGPVPTGRFGATLVTPDSARPLTPDQQDHIRRMQEELGMTNTPASFSPGASAGQMAPDMVPAILDSAVKTGVMAQIDLDQIIAMAPPQARQGIMDVIRTNKIALQADAPSLAASGMGQQQMAPNPVQRPQSQFADMRGPAPQSQTAGLRGAPPMEQTLAQYIAVKRKDPDMGAYPGSARVPLSRVGAEKTTEAQATKNVELNMAPKIAAATKNAERAVEQKSNATKSKYAVEGILNDVADRINTIDRLLRNPNRFSIVGAIEGNLPRLLQTGARADAQAAFDKIKNTATLTSLIDMRKSTDSGTSPVGTNPTDKDAKIVEQAASEFIQTGEPSKFDANLIDMRRKLYRTFQSAQREHEGVYADVLKENPNLRLAVPKVSDRYLSTKDLPKRRTSTKVDRNNPLLRGN